MSSSSGPLFACTRCNSRHPFEELSSGQQLCRECRGAFPIVKCTYCRTEFQQESKSNLNTICKKCEQNVKLYGKPTACEYCNIIAAFIGNKCQRCTNSEKRYGPPLPCEQCKQRCAFDRKDPESRKKVDGKLLCWLCTLSYKRALAKAKQNDTSIRHTSIHVHHKSRSSSSGKQKGDSRSHHHRTHHSGSSFDLIGNSASSSANKKPRLDIGKPPNGSMLSLGVASSVSDSSMMDLGNSDHVVAVTQLREQLASLHKQLSKDKQDLLEKDKRIAELKSQISRTEREWREKIQTQQRNSDEKINGLNQKISQLLKQNATLSKANKKNNSSNNSSSNNNNNNNHSLNNQTPNDSPLL